DFHVTGVQTCALPICCKYVAYIHDFLYIDYPQFFTFVERIVYRFITYSAKKADHVITITNSEKERIKKHARIGDDKISYVYHGEIGRASCRESRQIRA